MTSIAHEILSELHARGAIAYRTGDLVRMRPAEAITAELLSRVKAHKQEILPLLPETPPVRPAPPSAPALGADVSTWPARPFSLWVARAAALETEGLPADEADRKAADEIAAEMEAGPAEPWVWFSGDAGPFRLAGDEPPTANHPELVARAFRELAAMNTTYPDDDAACERSAERLAAVLGELRRVGVRAWLAS